MRFLSPLLAIFLAPLIAVAPVMAQLPAPGPTADSVPPAPSLQLRVLGGDAKMVPAGSHSAQGITVEVSEATGSQVANAAVVFRLPEDGPSATFADGSLSAATYTDSNGRARMADVHWGSVPGMVNVRITAVKGTAHAGVLFQQTLTAPTSPQSLSMPQVNALPPPVSAAESPNSQERPRTPGAIGQPESIAAVTVKHIANNRNADEDGPPVQVKTIPASAALADDDSPDANVPIRHIVRTGADEAEAPRVSISSAGPASKGGGHSKTKWLIALAAAAGAGAAFALVHHGGSSSSSSAVTVGPPTVSVGHP